MLGDLLDNRYRIIRTLSKGGFGQTYIAEDIRLPGHPYCVLKHLEPVALDSVQMTNARRLFETEAIALGRLGEHPQIPRLLAYFEQDGDFYIVQDLIRGYPLSKELKVGVKWAEADIYRLLHDVLSILVFVHDRGVIHRDIKPDNLIRRQPDRALVLVDFGSVKQIRTHAPVSDETGHTIAIGTMGYMAMEQARGRPRPNSDLYSLGIIGIQAATAMKPRFFQEDFETGELVWRNEADISGEMADFLTKMVAYHFKDRYGDAWEALRALEQLSVAKIVHRSESTSAASNHWPNSLTINHVASLVSSQKSGLEGIPPATSSSFSETITDIDRALALDNHTSPESIPQPTFIELPESTNDRPNTPLDAEFYGQETLPRVSQNFSDTVTLGPDYLPPKPKARRSKHSEVSPPLISPPISSPSPNSHQPSGSDNAGNDHTRQQVTRQSSTSSESAIEDGITSSLPYARENSGSPFAMNSTNAKAAKAKVKIDRQTVVTASAPLTATQPVVSTYPQVSASLFPSMSQVLQVGRDWFNQAIKTVHTKILPNQTNRFERSHSPLLSTKTLIFGSLGTLAVFGLGFRGYQGMQQQNQINASLLSIQNQHEKAQYEQCWEQAKRLQSFSHQAHDTAIQWEGQCAFSQATQLAEQQDFMSAIDVAQSIPETATSYYQESQVLIRKWFAQSLEQAEAQYDQGRVNLAIATTINLANNIPTDHPLQARIQLATLKWNLEQSSWLKSQRLLDERQWQAAIDQAQPLLHLPPFENKALGLINFAQDNLDIEDQQQDRQNPVVVQPLSSDPINGLNVSQNYIFPSRPQKRESSEQ
ncbi:MAG: serine/threonine protein kinase [Cyanothece sp. SIO2G6]|nr:serine/threonine protein kinase [Cyanothece sp. SIO2G6]